MCRRPERKNHVVRPGTIQAWLSLRTILTVYEATKRIERRGEITHWPAIHDNAHESFVCPRKRWRISGDVLHCLNPIA